PKVDFKTMEGILKAVASPNVATSMAAAQRIARFGGSGVFALVATADPKASVIAKARLFQSLCQVKSLDFREDRSKHQVPPQSLESMIRIQQRERAINKGDSKIAPLVEQAWKNLGSAEVASYQGARLESLLVPSS